MSRRDAMAAAATMAMLWAVPGRAEETGPLPLQTTGLEHIGMTVPDQKALAEWYGKIFDPQLFQERDPPPGFYVRMGTAYIAFGGTPDLQRATAHYTKFFGPPGIKKTDNVSFQIVNTRLVLEPVASGAKPAFQRLSFRIAGFDRKAVAAKLQKFQVETTSAQGDRALRFRDLNGFTIELVGQPR